MDIVTAALASALACSPLSDEKLAGLWESISVSRGGVGHNLEFRIDGSYTTATTVLVDLRYEIRDGEFFMSHNSGEEIDFSNGARIEETETDFTLTKDDVVEVKTKQTPTEEKTIVGTYVYRHYSGRMAYEKYTDDGKVIFRLPIESKSGCLKLDENMIFLQADEGQREFTYSMRGENLHLEESDGTRYAYKRVPEGAWYDSKNIDYEEPGE
tara:strand:- start:134 stop:769 length:636 start_codon:yes stop_codon:yes gene_type:complete